MINTTVRLLNSIAFIARTKSAAVAVLSFVLVTQTGCPNIVPTVKSLFGEKNGLSISPPSVQYANNSSVVVYTLTYSNISGAPNLIPGTNISAVGSVCNPVAVGCTGNTCTATITGCTGSGATFLDILAGTATDSSGNLLPAAQSSSFIVDNAAPGVSCSTPTGTYFVGNVSAGSLSCNDAGGVGCDGATMECSNDGGAGWSTTCSWTGLVNSTYNVMFRQRDLAGNISTNTACGTATVNNSSITITAPAVSSVQPNTATISGTCINGVTVNFNSPDVISPASTTCTASAFSALVTFSAGDGTKTVVVEQTDLASNTISNSRALEKDTTAPTGMSVTAASSLVSTSTVALTLSATDPNLSQMNIGLSCGGGTWIAYNTSAVSPTLTSNSVNTIYAQFRDTALNTTTCVSTVVTHDNTAPTFPIAISVTNMGALQAGNMETITWRTADANLDMGGVTVLEFYDGTSWNNISSTISSNNNTDTTSMWSVPSISCVSTCRLRVTTYDLTGLNMNSQTAPFSIVGPLNNFLVSHTATTPAGSSNNLTVTARDANNQTITNYTGTVTLTSTDPQVFNLPVSYGFTVPDAGTHVFTAVSLRTAGPQTITVQDGGVTNTTSIITVNAGTLSALSFTTQPSGGATAGTDFSVQPVVTLLDAFGNTLTTSTDTVNFAAYSDFTCTSSPTGYPLSVVSEVASAGVVTVSGMDYTKAEGIYIKASFGGYYACSNFVNVNPGVRDHFYISWDGPVNVYAGDSYSVTLIARDFYNNTDTNFTGTVNLTSPDLQIFNLPANYTFVPGDAGVRVFSGVEFRTAGTHDIQVSDGGIVNNTATVTVEPDFQDHVVFTGPVAPLHADECLAFTATRKDLFNNDIDNEPGALTISVAAAGLGGTGRIFSDPLCVNEIANINISSWATSQNFYYYDYVNAARSISLGGSAPALPGSSNTVNLTLNPRLPWGNGNDGNRTVVSAMTNVNTDTSVIGGRTLSAARQVTSNTLSSFTTTGFTASDFQPGDEVVWIVVGKGLTNSCDGGDNYKVGNYGFARILNTSSPNMTFDRNLPFGTFNNTNLTNPPNKGTNFCRLMVQRVPQFNDLTFVATGSLTAGTFALGPGEGGMVIARVKNNLNASATSMIDVSFKGFAGGLGGSASQYEGGSFTGQGDYLGGTGFPNSTGGSRGFYSAMNTGGGGGGNAGYGGVGYNGNPINGRSMISTGAFNIDKLFFGGGGGGAFHASENRAGGNGGGIIMLFANAVTGSGNTLGLKAFGQDGFVGGASGGYGGGGGGGGTIYAHFGTINTGVTIDKDVKGGRGGDVTTAGLGGGGGGGGGYIHIDYCSNLGTLNVSNVVGRIGGSAAGGNGESGQDGLDQTVAGMCP